MRKIELDIIALSHSVTQSHNYAVILQEHDGLRRLPIVIGGFEAQAIAVAMERMTPNRPLTHDLFRHTLDAFKIELKEILINNLLDGIFYSRLVCMRDGEIIEIDSRTSDALAMAVRFQCPVFTYDFILEAAGVIMDEPDAAETKRPSRRRETATRKETKTALSSYTADELEKVLNEMLQNENYERAAEIRDEMKRREGKS
ncbi:MAG: hypothetical protein RLZZ292_2363 [Bacteroidota bacterium]|jgi:bifunctional DNase/RNase